MDKERIRYSHYYPEGTNYDLMDPHTRLIIAGLLKYSLDDADFKFSKLHVSEKQIVGNQVNLDIIKKFVNDTLKE